MLLPDRANWLVPQDKKCLSLQTILLCIVMEFIGGGSVAVAVSVALIVAVAGAGSWLMQQAVLSSDLKSKAVPTIFIKII